MTKRKPAAKPARPAPTAPKPAMPQRVRDTAVRVTPQVATMLDQLIVKLTIEQQRPINLPAALEQCVREALERRQPLPTPKGL